MPHLWIENYSVLLALYANWKNLYKAAPGAEAANTWRRTAHVIRTDECAVEIHIDIISGTCRCPESPFAHEQAGWSTLRT